MDDEFERLLRRSGARDSATRQAGQAFGFGAVVVAWVALGFGLSCWVVWLVWWLLHEALPASVAYPTTQAMIVAVVLAIALAVLRAAARPR